jgi:hypothetical protein
MRFAIMLSRNSGVAAKRSKHHIHHHRPPSRLLLCLPVKAANGLNPFFIVQYTYRLGVAHFSMLKALKVLIFSYSLFCVLILIPP